MCEVQCRQLLNQSTGTHRPQGINSLCSVFSIYSFSKHLAVHSCSPVKHTLNSAAAHALTTRPVMTTSPSPPTVAPHSDRPSTPSNHNKFTFTLAQALVLLPLKICRSVAAALQVSEKLGSHPPNGYSLVHSNCDRPFSV